MYLVDNYKMTDEGINASNALFHLTWNVGCIRSRRILARPVPSSLTIRNGASFLRSHRLIRLKYLLNFNQAWNSCEFFCYIIVIFQGRRPRNPFADRVTGVLKFFNVGKKSHPDKYKKFSARKFSISVASRLSL